MKPTLNEVLSDMSKLETMTGEIFEKGETDGPTLDREAGRLELHITPLLRAWLLKVNGVTLPAADLFGVGPGHRTGCISHALNSGIKYRERGLLPIGSDGCGNDYVLEVSKGDHSPVIFTESSKNWSLAYVVASGLYQFLKFVILRSHNTEDQSWPFSEKFVLQRDPDMVKCQHVLPWNA